MAANSKRIKGQQGRSKRAFLSLIRKFHLLIFFVFVVIGLSVAVILINKTLTGTSAEGYTPNINNSSIDQATLDRIKSLHTSDQPPQYEMPAGRTNPFSE